MARKTRKPPSAKQQAARDRFAAQARARAASRRGGGRQMAFPSPVRGYLPAPSYALAPPVVQAEFLTAPPRASSPTRRRRSKPMARRRQSLTRRAANSIGRTRRTLGGGNRYGGRGLSKFKLKEAAAEALVETLGGGLSATIDEVSKLTENKVDDSILFRLGLKTGLTTATKWLFNRNKWAVHLAAGMQGDAGGSALREAGAKLGEMAKKK